MVPYDSVSALPLITDLLAGTYQEVVDSIEKLPVADLGCGDGDLATMFPGSSMRSAFTVCILAALFCRLILAATDRNQWKEEWGRRYDLKANLPFSLADAPFLSDEERAQIYAVVDDKTIHDSFYESGRDEERRTVLSSRVGQIALGNDGKWQIIVEAPRSFCGATGNCSIWIFAGDAGRLRLILQTGGNSLIISKNSTRGFHDMATAWHMSAEEIGMGVYRWDGREYKEVDCYSARFDSSDSNRPPLLTTCPGWPRR